MAARISMDSDSWWHIATGQLISENQSVPQTDSFSFTRLGSTWRYPSAAWISQWFMFQLYSLAGPAALNVAVAAIVTATFALLYFTLSGGPYLRALILILSAASSSVFWSARPHLATFFFFALFLLILENFRWKRTFHLYYLLPIMLIWVNSHPGFAFGLLLLFIYFIDELVSQIIEFRNQKSVRLIEMIRLSKVSHYLMMAFFLILVASVNPAGPQILTFPLETISIGILRDFIQEWQSPNFHSASLQPFIWTVILLFAAFAYSRKTKAISDILLIAVFAYMALLAGRNVALFALVSAPVLSRHLVDVVSRIANEFGFKLSSNQAPNRLQKILNVTILSVIILLALIKTSQIIPLEKNLEHFREILPVEAVYFLNTNPQQGRLFNSYNWGGYLIWELKNLPVYIDGRTDLYSDGLIGEWLSIVSAEEGWQEKLEFWKIDMILLEPHWPLVQALESNRWNLFQEFDHALLFLRQ